MGKPKAPLLSLGAQGTLGDAVTFTRRRGTNIIQEKPVPTYRRTLAQVYQRWLYEDYAYLWTQQSEATKRAYAASGSREHLTGFQYWMKYNLTNLPDIAGWWKLDREAGGITTDSSRNGNDGVIIGASPVTGLIADGLSFDGINDWVNCGNDPSLNITTEDFTIECLLNPPGLQNNTWISRFAVADGYICTLTADGFVRARLTTSGVSLRFWAAAGYTAADFGQFRHFAWRKRGTVGSILKDGVDITTFTNVLQPMNPAVIDFGISPNGPWGWATGLMDNLIVYTRALDDTEILRHSERRYAL